MSGSPIQRRMSAARRRVPWLGVVMALGMALGVSGCATQRFNQARTDFYRGQLSEAEAVLDEADFPRRDQVLVWMERGTVRQARGAYAASSADYIAAYDRLVELERLSISRGSGSLVINDQIKDFVGAPYERTLLHAMTAHNHLALGDWDNAAVEGRRLVISLSDDVRGKYPEDAYSRYLAGLTFALIDDDSNAALQYRLADALLDDVAIDPRSGWLAAGSEAPASPWPLAAGQEELIVLLQIGQSAWGRYAPGRGQRHYAEVEVDGRVVGRSVVLADTVALREETERLRAVAETAKFATRIAIKEGIAQAVESSNNEAAGDLVRLILIGLLEQPDNRAWQTLPRWFHVARVVVPAGTERFTVVLKRAGGGVVGRHEVQPVIQRRRNQAVAVVRL